MKDIVETFQLGDDVAIILPKKFGVRPGQKFKIEKDKEKIILIPID